MSTGILGVLGAHGCGKTTLVRAITGEDTDRLKDEKERGLSIEAAFAVLDMGNGTQLSLADLPGHEKYVRHLLAGLSGVSGILLVIAADQGVMPQTREHLAICRILGVAQGCIVVTGIDQVEPDLLTMVIEEVRDLARGSFLQGAPAFSLSSVTGEGIAPLRSWLAEGGAASAETKVGSAFRMSVDRTFTLPDGGLVLTGAVLAGRVSQGESLLLYPKMLPVRVQGLQVHRANVTEAVKGSRVAVNLQGVDETMIERGDILAAPGCLSTSHILDVDFSSLASHPERFRNRTAVRVHWGAAELAGHIVLLETDELAPGERAAAQLFLEEPIVAWPGDRFLLRSYSPPLILGGGVVYNGLATRRKRHVDADIFTYYRRGAIEQVAVLHVQENGFQGLTLSELALRLGISEKRVRKVLEAPLSTRQLLLVGGGRQQLLSRDAFEAMKERTVRLLASFHDDFPDRDALSVEELRHMVYGGMEPMLMRLILDELAKGGTARTLEEGASLSPDRPLSSRIREWLWHELTHLYRDAALAPPTLREVTARFPRQGPEILRGALEALASAGVLCKVNGDLYFYNEVFEALRDKLIHHLQDEGRVDIQGFKSLTCMTRKFLVPVLEYLDETGVTKRLDDDTTRVLRARMQTGGHAGQQGAKGVQQVKHH